MPKCILMTHDILYPFILNLKAVCRFNITLPGTPRKAYYSTLKGTYRYINQYRSNGVPGYLVPVAHNGNLG